MAREDLIVDATPLYCFVLQRLSKRRDAPGHLVKPMLKSVREDQLELIERELTTQRLMTIPPVLAEVDRRFREERSPRLGRRPSQYKAWKPTVRQLRDSLLDEMIALSIAEKLIVVRDVIRDGRDVFTDLGPVDAALLTLAEREQARLLTGDEDLAKLCNRRKKTRATYVLERDDR